MGVKIIPNHTSGNNNDFCVQLVFLRLKSQQEQEQQEQEQQQLWY